MTNDRDRGPDRADAPEGPPDWVDGLRAAYNPPPTTPRDEMWVAIHEGLQSTDTVSSSGSGSHGADSYDQERSVVDLARRRRRMAGRASRGDSLSRRWAWAAAAAAVLAVGIGIGRWSAPGASPGSQPLAVDVTADAPGSGLDIAAELHFGRTESLLASVRSDARTGRVDVSLGPWAQGLLTQTRLLMDARGGARDETQRLLIDLELVLVQILGAVEVGFMDGDRAREELEMAVRSLEHGELLTRIRSAAPTTMAGA